MRILSALLAFTLAACTRPATIPPLTLPFSTDTVAEHVIADGVVHRYIRSPKGPWAINVLDVDLSRCWRAVAVKGAPGAAGRKKTSVLLEELGATREVIGGVNADFFTLAGFQGVPTGALISAGKVVVGPGPQPVLAFDSAGKPTAAVFTGTVRLTGRDYSITASWNRPSANGVAVYDRAWGTRLDTASGVVEIVAEGTTILREVSRDTSVAGEEIPTIGYVVVIGRNVPEDQRRSFMSMTGVTVEHNLLPFHPMEAVGGRPILARDSVVVPDVETEGAVSFRARNPRTAVGIANNGKRLILAVIDGRQAPYSDGTTLRETAEIMLALGARDAINLDGGGSSALVYRDPHTRTLRVANKPSDAIGERAVGDALGIVKGCGR
jgi:hypothetical protein